MGYLQEQLYIPNDLAIALSLEPSELPKNSIWKWKIKTSYKHKPVKLRHEKIHP